MKRWCCLRCAARFAIRPKSETEAGFAKRCADHENDYICQARQLTRRLINEHSMQTFHSHDDVNSAPVLRDAGLLQEHRTRVDWVTDPKHGERKRVQITNIEHWSPRWAVAYAVHLGRSGMTNRERVAALRDASESPEGIERAQAIVALAGRRW